MKPIHIRVWHACFMHGMQQLNLLHDDDLFFILKFAYDE
jgi:hypothetical protein